MTETFEAEIVRLERMRNSINGNPRWKVNLADGRVLATAVDTADAGKLSSYWEGRSARLTLDGRSNIVGIEELPE